MIGLALSGGGSRAIAFHLGCLRALNDLGILDQINVISTISGGSVIGAYYAYTPKKSFEDFTAEMEKLLSQGLQRQVALELVKPGNLLRCSMNAGHAYLQEFLPLRFRKMVSISRCPSRTDMFQRVLDKRLFEKLTMRSQRRNGMAIVVGATELMSGTAFRFSPDRSGDWRHGEMVNGDVDVAFAVAASAAYPIFLPALDRTVPFLKNGEPNEHRVSLTDGGIYDNLGIQVLEPGRSLKVSLHSFSCDYLIVCNAGRGQESSLVPPNTFVSRASRSFEVVHRRVQDSAMHRLHQLKDAVLVKGFVLPYLGQQDDRLPWRPPDLISRESVISYPTDFAPMRDEWVRRLSDRGEQLTRALVPHYLPELLS